jgi:hypothetical protein
MHTKKETQERRRRRRKADEYSKTKEVNERNKTTFLFLGFWLMLTTIHRVYVHTT